MKKHIIVAVLLISFFSPLWATPAPQELMIDVSEKVISKLKEEQVAIDKDPGKLYLLVDDLVLPHFDFDRTSKWVLGKYWLRATDEQKQRFVIEFKHLLVRTYAKSLNEFVDKKFNYLPFRGKDGATNATVRMEVDEPGGFPIPINYKLHLKEGVWKLYDVEVDGISLVANYRTSFSKEIRKKGLDRLIEKLAKGNQKNEPASS